MTEGKAMERIDRLTEYLENCAKLSAEGIRQATETALELLYLADGDNGKRILAAAFIQSAYANTEIAALRAENARLVEALLAASEFGLAAPKDNFSDNHAWSVANKLVADALATAKASKGV